MPTYDENGALLITGVGILADHQHSAVGDGGPLAVGVTDTDLTAGSVWFAGVGGLLQEDNANLFWNNATNRIGILTNNPLAPLDVSSGVVTVVIGADNGATTRTDATLKICRVGVPHYLNAEQQMGILAASSDVASSVLSLGGGTSTFNAVTNIRFFTAANTITLTGTERIRIGSAGNVGIGNQTLSRRLHATDDSASTNVIIPIARLEAQVSGGAGAAGHGPSLELYGESSTTLNQPMGQIAATWQTPTHASRRAQLRFFADLQGTLYPVGTIVGPNTAPAVPAVAAWGIGAVDFQTYRANATDVAGALASTISGGISHVISGDYGVISGGALNEVSEDYGMIPGGWQAVADKYGQFAHASGRFSADGDAQRSAFVARRDRATHAVGTWYSLFLNGTTTQMTIAASTAWTFRALVVGLTANAAQQWSYEVVGLIERDNAGNTTLAASTTSTIFESDANYDAQAVADNVNEALEIQVQRTGGVDYSVQWVAVIHTVECTHI